MAETILVIEDDPEAGGVLADVLNGAGYSVVLTRSGADALRLASTTHFGLILLDLLLPDSDGLILVIRLRALTDCPILVCSARASQADRVISLKLGADDFIAEPFDLEELEARVAAVLRRSHGRQSDSDADSNELRVGELVIAQSRGTARIGGRSLELTPTEYRLLAHLATHQGHVQSRRMLAGAVWAYADSGTDHMIDVHIARLRKKIREAGGEPIIITVHGSGFALESPNAAISARATARTPSTLRCN